MLYNLSFQSFWIFRYKYSVLLFLFIGLIIYYPIGFSLSPSLFLATLNLFLIIRIVARFKYNWLLWGVLSVIFATNAYISFTYKSWLYLGILSSIVETNTVEVTSMLKSIGLPAFALFALSFFLLVKSGKELRQSRLSFKYSVLFVLIYSVLFLPMMIYRRIVTEGTCLMYHNKPAFIWQQAVMNYSPIIYGNFAVYKAYMEEVNSFLVYENQEKKDKQGIEYNENQDSVEKIFLVIGESATRTHWSSYGYNVKTTPFVDSLVATSPEKIRLYDAYSAASITRYAVPFLLSFVDMDDFTVFYHYNSIVKIAEKSGYETYWMSNQFKMCPFQGYTVDYVGMMASDAKYQFFTPTATEDLELIDAIKKEKKEGLKQFFVVHLYGSHMSYIDRYDDIDKKAINGSATDIELHYDRTIHHTDRVLRELYNLIKDDESALMYYVSDHGEVIGYGHGAEYSVDQFEVPMALINTSSVDVDSIMNKYKSETGGFMNSSCTPFFMSEFLGCSVDTTLVKEVRAIGDVVYQGDGSIHEVKNLERYDGKR